MLFRDQVIKQFQGALIWDYLVHKSHGGEDHDPKIGMMKYRMEQLEKLKAAVIYLLDVRQAELFKGEAFGYEGFPPLPHPSLWVEFNGLLRFNYSPLVVEEAIIGEGLEISKPVDRERFGYCEYRGVLIYESLPPHNWSNWPEERVLRAEWVERPKSTVELHTKGLIQTPDGTVKTVNVYHDCFTLTMCASLWPRLVNEHHFTMDPGEKEQMMRHVRRLQRMTANLLYFLSAENVQKIRIRPGHRQRYGEKEFRGLPKTEEVIHVLPFQLQRYRYLLGSNRGGGTAHHYRYDVRGHFRHLRDERYERNPDGTVRVVWVRPHERGVDHPEYVPTLRVGEVGRSILEYDEFVRRVERRRAKIA